MELGNLVSFPMRIIWNSWVQPRMSFFAWEAKWVKALILNQVQRQGWSLANGCYIRQMDKESIDLILIHHVRTKVLWELLFTLFGVSWVLPLSVRETLPS